MKPLEEIDEIVMEIVNNGYDIIDEYPQIFHQRRDEGETPQAATIEFMVDGFSRFNP